MLGEVTYKTNGWQSCIAFKKKHYICFSHHFLHQSRSTLLGLHMLFFTIETFFFVPWTSGFPLAHFVTYRMYCEKCTLIVMITARFLVATPARLKDRGDPLPPKKNKKMFLQTCNSDNCPWYVLNLMPCHGINQHGFVSSVILFFVHKWNSIGSSGVWNLFCRRRKGFKRAQEWINYDRICIFWGMSYPFK